MNHGGRQSSLGRSVRYIATWLAVCGLSMACADTNKPTTRPASLSERQERALSDPFEYAPQDAEMPTVSGGGTGTLDKKGLKRDWDSFWNP